MPKASKKRKADKQSPSTEAPPAKRSQADVMAEIEALWPEASHLPWSAVSWLNRQGMWQAYNLLGLSPTSIVAGFAHALKSKYQR